MNGGNILGEFLGTFLFILSILASGGNPLIIGAALIFIIYMLQRMSGGHVNPAVSAAMYFSGSVDFNTMIAYFAVQFAAAYIAVKVYNYIYA